jgi:hypothetical protein
VIEISEKLANFDIETDTDASVYPTDTGRSHSYGDNLKNCPDRVV